MARYLSPKHLIKNRDKYKLNLYQYQVKKREKKFSGWVAWGRAYNISAENQRKLINKKYPAKEYVIIIKLVK